MEIVRLQVGGRVSDFVSRNFKEVPFVPLTGVSVYTADTREKIPFILGQALYMKAIHGGKAKNARAECLKGFSTRSGRRADPRH